MEQSRWKSPVFWSGIAAQLIALLLFANVITPQQSEIIEKAVAIALIIYSAFPMANNPTSKAGF